MSVPIVMVVSPPRCVVVVTAPPMIVTWRPNIYADAPRSCVNIHFCERWHRCRGDQRACGDHSKCELLHGAPFIGSFLLPNKNDFCRLAVPNYFCGVHANVTERLHRLRRVFTLSRSSLLRSHGKQPRRAVGRDCGEVGVPLQPRPLIGERGAARSGATGQCAAYRSGKCLIESKCASEAGVKLNWQS